MPSTKKSKKRNPAPEQFAPDEWSLRKAVTVRVGISDRTLRRFEKQLGLRVLPDSKGRFRMHPDDLERLVNSAAPISGTTSKPVGIEADAKLPTVTTVPVADPSDDGVGAARVFKLFSEGKTRRQVVEILELPPSLAQRLYVRWIELGGGLVFDGPDLDAMATMELNVASKKSVLTSIGAAAHDARIHRGMRVPCACGCGQMIHFSLKMFAWLMDRGALAGWHLPEHAEASERRRQDERAREEP